MSTRGFTLLELLVVLAIIGILVSIAIPLYATVVSNAEAQTCAANRRIIHGAVLMFKVDTGTWPEDMDDGSFTQLSSFLDEPISCPSDGTYGFFISNGSVTVYCSSHTD